MSPTHTVRRRFPKHTDNVRARSRLEKFVSFGIFLNVKQLEKSPTSLILILPSISYYSLNNVYCLEIRSHRLEHTLTRTHKMQSSMYRARNSQIPSITVKNIELLKIHVWNCSMSTAYKLSPLQITRASDY